MCFISKRKAMWGDGGGRKGSQTFKTDSSLGDHPVTAFQWENNCEVIKHWGEAKVTIKMAAQKNRAIKENKYWVGSRGNCLIHNRGNRQSEPLIQDEVSSQRLIMHCPWWQPEFHTAGIPVRGCVTTLDYLKFRRVSGIGKGCKLWVQWADKSQVFVI